MHVTRRDFVHGVSAAAAWGVVGARATASKRRDPTQSAAPIDLNRHGTFDGIVNLYVGNDVDLAQAKRLGAEAIIYRTSIGLRPDKDDRKAYRAAKARASELGLLWGAFHVPGIEDVDRQLAYFLEIEDGSDQRTLMVLDWETTKEGVASLEQVRQFVRAFYNRQHYYPMLYGGNHLYEQCRGRHDAVLANCPLWYIDILTPQHPTLRLPTPTWQDYTLWQYATDHRLHNDPYPRDVLPGADWSRYKGTVPDLRRAWPFRHA